MKKSFVALMAIVITLGVLAPLVIQADTASACAGFSPGYWKNHRAAWEGTGYSPTDSFVGVFGLDLDEPDYWFYTPDDYVPPATLLDALQSKGGQWDALNRQAVASLLNAASGLDGWDIPPYDEEWVKGAVRYAYVFNKWESVKDMLAGFNSL